MRNGSPFHPAILLCFCFLFLEAAFADQEGPVLTSLSINKTSIDVTNKPILEVGYPEYLTIDITATDATDEGGYYTAYVVFRQYNADGTQGQGLKSVSWACVGDPHDTDGDSITDNYGTAGCGPGKLSTSNGDVGANSIGFYNNDFDGLWVLESVRLKDTNEASASYYGVELETILGGLLNRH